MEEDIIHLFTIVTKVKRDVNHGRNYNICSNNDSNNTISSFDWRNTLPVKAKNK